MTHYQDELALVNHLVERLEQRLSGRHTKRLVNRLPVDECHLGVLVPWRSPEEPDAVDSENLSEDPPIVVSPATRSESPGQPFPAGVETSAPPASDRAQRAPEQGSSDDGLRRPPSALGCELLVSGEGDAELTLEVRFAVYTQHLPTFEEQHGSQGQTEWKFQPSSQQTEPSPASGKKSGQGAMSLAEVFERQDVCVPDVHFTLTLGRQNETWERTRLQEALNAVVHEALMHTPLPRFEGKGVRPAPPTLPEEALLNPQTFEAHLKQHFEHKPIQRPTPKLEVSLLVRTQPVAEGKTRISLYFSNDTQRGEIRTQDNINIVADVRLIGRIDGAKLEPIEILPVARDYQYDRRVWGVGHNTSVMVDRDKGNFSTHALARFDQPRLITREQVAVRFAELGEAPLPILERIHLEMLAEVETWKGYLSDNPDMLDAEFHAACRADLERFTEEVRRFAAGVAALTSDIRLMQAFMGMNRVMGRVGAKKNFEAWRLFQICFIVTQMPALALRENIKGGEWPAGQAHRWDDEVDIADVLWFPTGGGKTESYLGLICCAMLHDRLRGKALGLTAWLRFPLRMLSIQQLQRAMGVIFEAQVELETLMPDGGGDPLRLGYFVGSSTTPNTVDAKFFERYKSVQDCERYRVVTDCPRCDGRGTVRLHPEPDALRLIRIPINLVK